ncbi:hypothetical protein M9H77_01752 [Catharanthus roseus]|uniref:Uncharacterized protein n=1 Tax=Catharanthus roseus TaxID=4058 RepID=A0ACC0C6F3_CATRO|nr:hypothetical protein M9H77_01752 [Catharanthus roseus]
MYGDLCAISFDGGLFLVESYASTYLSSHVSLEDPLMSSGVKFDPYCHGFDILDDTSIVGPNIAGFKLDCDLFDVLPDKLVRPKEIKANDGNVDNGMVGYMENALKFKFEVDPAPTVAGRPLPAPLRKHDTYHARKEFCLSMLCVRGLILTGFLLEWCSYKILNRGSSLKEVILGKE